VFTLLAECCLPGATESRNFLEWASCAEERLFAFADFGVVALAFSLALPLGVFTSALPPARGRMAGMCPMASASNWDTDGSTPNSFGFVLELLLDVFLSEGVVCTLLCEG